MVKLANALTVHSTSFPWVLTQYRQQHTTTDVLIRKIHGSTPRTLCFTPCSERPNEHVRLEIHASRVLLLLLYGFCFPRFWYICSLFSSWQRREIPNCRFSRRRNTPTLHVFNFLLLFAILGVVLFSYKIWESRKGKTLKCACANATYFVLVCNSTHRMKQNKTLIMALNLERRSWLNTWDVSSKELV